MQSPSLLHAAQQLLAETYVWRNGQYVPSGGSASAEPFLVKLAVRFGWLVLIAIGVVVYRAFPNRQALVGKILLCIGFALVIPFLAVVWTGHAEDMRYWDENRRLAVLISAGMGAAFVFTGGAFWYARRNIDLRDARVAAAAAATSTASREAPRTE